MSSNTMTVMMVSDTIWCGSSRTSTICRTHMIPRGRYVRDQVSLAMLVGWIVRLSAVTSLGAMATRSGPASAPRVVHETNRYVP